MPAGMLPADSLRSSSIQPLFMPCNCWIRSRMARVLTVLNYGINLAVREEPGWDPNAVLRRMWTFFLGLFAAAIAPSARATARSSDWRVATSPLKHFAIVSQNRSAYSASSAVCPCLVPELHGLCTCFPSQVGRPTGPRGLGSWSSGSASCHACHQPSMRCTAHP